MSYTTLISAEDLHERLQDPSLVIVDCRFTLGDTAAGFAEYQTGHLPGARYAHLDRDLSSPITDQSGRHPLPNPADLAKQLGDWGIDNKTQIIAYDDTNGAFAARLWWLSRWLGHRDVAVLDGGLTAWHATGFGTTTAIPQPRSARFDPRPDKSMWLTTNDVVQQLAAGELLLVDARKKERFLGQVEPIDPVAGHVPGAINLPFAENWNAEGRFLAPSELRQRFAELRADASAQSVAHMCGSGITACINLLAMEHAGLPYSKLFAGSWSEYNRDPSRPVASGEV